MRSLGLAGPGVLIVTFALVEVFRDLFHPSLTGTLSDFVARTVFRAFRRRASLLSLAGPLALLIVILCWALLLTTGFALIYWAAFPAEFRAFNGQAPVGQNAFWQMLYFSLQAMTTLGLGDVVPEANWLRVLVGMEALLGFGLVTASVSWIVLIYPALARMRALARRTAILGRAERTTGIALISEHAEHLLEDLALDVCEHAWTSFTSHHLLLPCRPPAIVSSGESLPQLVRFAQSGSNAKASERVRLAAEILRSALDDLAEVLADRFVKADSSDAKAVFRAYAEDHRAPSEQY